MRSTLIILCVTLWSCHITGTLQAQDAADRKTSSDEEQNPYGLEAWEPWTTSRVTGSPDPPPPYRVERVFPKLTFKNPVEFVAVPGSDRLLIAEFAGPVRTFRNVADAETTDVAIDLAEHHPDLTAVYGFAFHPQFETNRLCYIAYVLKNGAPDGTRVSRFRMTELDPPRIDPASEEVVIAWLGGGHNGACIQFGPDGYLYVSTGDGSGAFPPDGLNAGQDVSNLLSAILRIDVDHSDGERPYRIPGDNPFVELQGARGEIWAYGLRNPWKMSFDSATGDLWTGDVGWELWEMVYRVEKGGNYGWSITEGPQSVHQERKRGPTPILPPTMAHPHTESYSVTGGYVYHGAALPDLVGAYVYGDYVTGKIWGLRFEDGNVTWHEELCDTPLAIVCFGVDAAQELYVVHYGDSGTIHRLVANPLSDSNQQFPRKLSETGIFASVGEQVPAAGVIPYSINAEPWADHARAERFVAIPAESVEKGDRLPLKLGAYNAQPQFPHETIFAKTLSLEMERGNPASRRRVETQLFQYDTGIETWRPYSYVWNDAQTDAMLVDAAGAQRSFEVIDAGAPSGRRTQVWKFASRTECLVCHNSYNNGSILGFHVSQLNREHDYGHAIDNQLSTLAHIGLMEPVGDDPPVMASPTVNVGTLEERTRAYLHVNCAHCHRNGGGGTAWFHVRADMPLERSNLFDRRPSQGTFGIHGAQVVAAGDPFRSVLLYRMAKSGPGHMPHLGAELVDKAGVTLMHDWIAELQPAEAGSRVGAATDSERVPFRAEQSVLLEQLRASAQRPASETKPLIDRLLNSTSGALAVLHELDGDGLPPAIRERAIAAAIDHPQIVVRDLFERFAPDEERSTRLGSIVRPDDILAVAGVSRRGRSLFFDLEGITCRNCHQINGRGQQLGPDLSEVGKKYDRRKILESILEPSKTIDPKYVPYLVETKRGQVHTGLLIRRTAEEVVLQDATRKEVRIDAGDVELLAPQRRSLMPELLLRDMTAEQTADLLAFLSSLKQSEAQSQ